MRKLSKNLQLLLFILENSKDIQDMTEMKVYKLLYFLGKEYHNSFGKDILTGVTKNTYGPVVCGITGEEFFSEFIEFKNEGNKSFYILKQQDFTLNFSEDQREVLYSALDRYKRLQAHELVTLSHKEAPYLMTEKGGKIDFKNTKYNTVIEDSLNHKEEGFMDFSKEEENAICGNLIAKYG